MTFKVQEFHMLVPSFSLLLHMKKRHRQLDNLHKATLFRECDLGVSQGLESCTHYDSRELPLKETLRAPCREVLAQPFQLTTGVHEEKLANSTFLRHVIKNSNSYTRTQRAH